MIGWDVKNLAIDVDFFESHCYKLSSSRLILNLEVTNKHVQEHHYSILAMCIRNL